jgi:ferrous iron transport protein A
MSLKLISVGDLESGVKGVVRQLRGAREFTRRMASLGFTVGTELTVVQNYGHGPVIVSLRNTRVALGRGEAFKVVVEVKPAD